MKKTETCILLAITLVIATFSVFRKGDVMPENYINAEDIIKADMTDTGILLTFADGSGYFIDTIN